MTNLYSKILQFYSRLSPPANPAIAAHHSGTSGSRVSTAMAAAVAAAADGAAAAADAGFPKTWDKATVSEGDGATFAKAGRDDGKKELQRAAEEFGISVDMVMPVNGGPRLGGGKVVAEGAKVFLHYTGTFGKTIEHGGRPYEAGETASFPPPPPPAAAPAPAWHRTLGVIQPQVSSE